MFKKVFSHRIKGNKSLHKIKKSTNRDKKQLNLVKLIQIKGKLILSFDCIDLNNLKLYYFKYHLNLNLVKLFETFSPFLCCLSFEK